MIILISGATHTGKTALAQKLLETYHYPYLSIDHLKMGLIRSKKTDLTVFDDEELVEYLWPIILEIIKTAIENKQNLIIEGAYLPFHWQEYFAEDYLKWIEFYCIIMTQTYIQNNFSVIVEHANIIEKRLTVSEITMEMLIEENRKNLEQSRKYGNNIILIDKDYELDLAGYFCNNSNATRSDFS